MDPLTILLIAAAGVADGFNPCSFAGLLVFASVTTATLCHEVSPQGAEFSRRKLIRYGSTWIVALFVTYSAIGLGFLGSIRLLVAEGHWAGKAAAVAAVAMGLWMVRDYLFPKAGMRMEPPAHLKRLAGKYLRVLTVPGIFVAGFLVGLCTIPCSGGIYLSVLAMISSQESSVGIALLSMYNLMFVLPLIVVLVASTNRRTYLAVARWHVRWREHVKIVLAGVMIALGFVTLVLIA